MIIKKSDRALAKAVSLLKSGKVLICPTDTVYGFLADASSKKAVDAIYKIKRRSKSKPLSVFVKDIKMTSDVAIIDKKQLKSLKKYWPGKYTFILKRKSGQKLFGLKKDSIGVRIPKYLFLQKLLKKIDRPLVQTSVNLASQEPLNNVEQIVATFGKSKLVGLIIDVGDIKNAKPSKIIDLTHEKTIKLR